MFIVKSTIIMLTIIVAIAAQESIDEDILITDDPLTVTTANTAKVDTSSAGIPVKDPERLFLAYTDLALPLGGTFTLAFERTIKHRRTLGISGLLSDEIRKPGLRSITIYLGMNFYSKKAFNGWFIAPNIGYMRDFKMSRNISINLHGGYRWELPRSFSIGFGCGPGVSGAVFREDKSTSLFGFDFFGGFYLGKAFGG